MHGTIKRVEQARERAYSIPLEQFDVGHPDLFRDYTFWPCFKRLRKEEPVHYCPNGMFGLYWSVTKYTETMDVETKHAYTAASACGLQSCS
jgi:hypothetical protein